MPRIKKPRAKGLTYRLVPRSYGDANGEEGPLWVSEAEFHRQHNSAAPAEDDEAARRQFNMYAVAANAEFNDDRRRRRRTDDGGDHGDDADGGVYDDAGEGEAPYTMDDEEDWEEEEEGEWVDGDWEEEGEEEEEGEWEDAHPSPPPPPPASSQRAAASPAVTTGGAGAASHLPAGAARLPAEPRVATADEMDEEQEEMLFEDEVECEVTDDFLRQLVFGTGTGAGGGDDDEDEDEFMMADDDDLDELDEADGEMWRLLTEEEKAAIRATRRRGTARRRRVVAAIDGEGGVASRTHAADGTEYPMHDTTQRALDRQFTEMMREFNADARLNDAYTEDPRTFGALPMDKYLSALEEFVADRAGVDVETAEPHKNKGLIQQLRYLSHHVGAFDSDARGMYMTTTLPEKQQRFVEEFQKGTEEIRRAARMRVAQRAAAAAAAAAAASSVDGQGSSSAPVPEVSAAAASAAEEAEEAEDLIVVEVKPKADRLDCETAVSAYSTYYNQPNVIQAPRRGAPARRLKKTTTTTTEARRGGEAAGTTVVRGNVISSAASAPGASGAAGSISREDAKPLAPESRSDSGSDNDDTATATVGGRGGVDVLLTVRHKDETKEEKKLRRQAVKTAQRERRQAKSALKHTYKEVESEELKRTATSQAARRTVHFM